MKTLTIWERIVLHLSRYDLHSPGEYNTSWDLTQDGVASSLRITRAHASIELKKLKTAGKVEETYTHVKGNKSKRKTYTLTPLGLSEAKRIKGFIEEEGITLMPLLDMKRYGPDVLDSLDDESRYVLDMASVLRVQVKRETLCRTKPPAVPVDADGYILLSDNVKNMVLSAADDERLTQLHSEAADYWLKIAPDGKERLERLYHLMKAGRVGEACRLLINERNEFMDDPSSDLWHILSDMDRVPEKYLLDILPMRIAVALEYKDAGSARAAAERLAAADDEKGMLFMADVELADGSPEKAMELLGSCENCSDRAGWSLRMAGCLAALGRYEETRKLLEDTKKEINRTGDLSCLNDVYILLSTVLIKMGFPEDAITQLNKAKSSAGKRDMWKIDLKLGEAHTAKGLSARD